MMCIDEIKTTQRVAATLFFLLFAMTAASSHGEEGQPPASGEGRKKVSVPAKEDAVKKPKKELKFFYDPAGRRDPFSSFLVNVPVLEEEAEEEGIPLTELQQYEISQLNLVAVVEMGDKNMAMVQDPQGKGHSLYVGTLIGKHRGKVVVIERRKVSIEEKHRNVLGGVESKIIELIIESPDGGKI